MQDKTTQEISDTFRQFIEALVEEVVLNGEPFDAQKKWLRRYCDAESVGYTSLVTDLEDLFQIIEEWRSSQSKSGQIAMKTLAKDCYLSEERLESLLTAMSNIRRGGGILDGHAYVDLGLPSGTLWATCNIGATKPEEYGDYFAWGETEPKTTYRELNYKYCTSGCYCLTKYCNMSKYGNNGFTDNLTTLESGDDAATANWGSDWCIPSADQWRELMDNTNIELTTRNGVNGMLFIASNGNSLFLPAAGYRGDNKITDVGLDGGYWSSSFHTDGPIDARCFSFRWDDYDDYDVSGGGRYFGHSVRAVRSARQN